MPYWNEPGLTWSHPLARYNDQKTFAEILNPSHRMLDVVLDTKNVPVPDLITKIGALCAAAKSKTDFASMVTFLTALEGKLALLEAEQANLRSAENTVKALTVVRDQKLADVTDDLATLAADLGKNASSEAAILEIGARLKDKPSPRPVPGVPQNFFLTEGDEEGELTGHCDSQGRLVDFYEVRYTTTDPNADATVWIKLDPVKRSTFDLQDLPSGQKVWVQIRAVNTTGKSPWCDPACKRVP